MDTRTGAPARSWMGDLALAALLTAAITVISSQIEPDGNDRALDGLAYAVIVTCGGALAARRRHPVAVVLVITAGLSVWIARGYVGGPVFVTGWLSLFFLAYGGDRRRAFTVAAVTAGALVTVGLVSNTSPGLIHLVYVGWSAAAVFLGDALRSRREHMAGLEERARNLEQTREEETRRRLAEERLQIARDLHDTVAHSMATINVQAGAAAHVIDRQPEQARAALQAIQQASGDVLDELSALLGLLRVDPGETAGRAPTPGLEQLDDLAASVRNAGLEVTLQVDTDDPVPRPVSVAAYRIVQESLTNVVRHAGTPAARVTVTRDGDGILSVEVVDDGRGRSHSEAGAGVGIRGMRERAESTGGRLEAGPRDSGGFRVIATWPTA